MPRQTALTPKVAERILGFLRQGNYIEVSAKGAGIHRDTFYGWMQRARTGKPEDAKFADFAEQVDVALAEAEARDLQTILIASKESWQAAAWRLERRYPDRWSRNDRMKVEGNVEVDVSDDGLLGKLARLLTGVAKAPDPPELVEGGEGAA
jgi:transposase